MQQKVEIIASQSHQSNDQLELVDMPTRMAGNFREHYNFREKSDKAPELIFVVLNFVAITQSTSVWGCASGLTINR